MTFTLSGVELLPAAWHRTDRYANNHIEADHGRLKSRLRSMRGLKQDHNASVIIVRDLDDAYCQPALRHGFRRREGGRQGMVVAAAEDERVGILAGGGGNCLKRLGDLEGIPS